VKLPEFILPKLFTKSLTHYTYSSVVSLHIVVLPYMFGPYAAHHHGETWLQKTHMTYIYRSPNSILAQLKIFIWSKYND
jgi:hypothetical protein